VHLKFLLVFHLLRSLDHRRIWKPVVLKETRESAAFAALSLILSRSAVTVVRLSTVDKAAKESTGRNINRSAIPRVKQILVFRQKVVLLLQTLLKTLIRTNAKDAKRSSPH